MKKWNTVFSLTVLLLFAAPAAAQSDDEETVRESEARELAYAARLRDAEARMEEAARQIAEISRERLPKMVEIERRFAFSKKPMIGITIDGSDDSGPVDGVSVEGVTPGGAADDAGLRAGDIITAVNDESMSAENSNSSNELLFDFMHGVEEDDVLTIEYLRNGNSGSVELSPRITKMHAFSSFPDGHEFHVGKVPGVANAVRAFRFDGGFPWAGSSFGLLELVKLNEGLGRYFGTDTGLLVVSAPESKAFQLEDGDVLQSIDGREPKTVRQALKIFSTYDAGDAVTLGIMRDKKKRELEVEIPEADYRGMRFDPAAPQPVRPTNAPVHVRPTPPSSPPRPTANGVSDDVST